MNKLNKFYFTFGTDKQYPYKNGYVLVLAKNQQTAINIFNSHFPPIDSCINCAFCYSEKEYNEALLHLKHQNLPTARFTICHKIIPNCNMQSYCPYYEKNTSQCDTLKSDSQSVYLPQEYEKCHTTGCEVYNPEHIGHKEIQKPVQNNSECTRLRAFDIQWDVDEQVDIPPLPHFIDIPKDITDEDEISDYLSDITGFCHKGFRLEIIKENEK